MNSGTFQADEYLRFLGSEHLSVIWTLFFGVAGGGEQEVGEWDEIWGSTNKKWRSWLLIFIVLEAMRAYDVSDA